MLFEAVTLHRRFPFAVLVGMFFFDEGAAGDDTSKRRSTFENAHRQFRLFTDRPDPEGREEQFERFYIALHNANPTSPSFRFFRVGDSSRAIALDAIFDDVIDLLVARNPDFYESIDGVLRAI
ncbi:MAG: hypothetical protein KC466_11680 [Myxococcales bacterium]|nr:hypothetical protein [Myxococcales bacterium]